MFDDFSRLCAHMITSLTNPQSLLGSLKHSNRQTTVYSVRWEYGIPAARLYEYYDRHSFNNQATHRLLLVPQSAPVAGTRTSDVSRLKARMQQRHRYEYGN